MRDVTLHSGAKLMVGNTPFAESKALYQVLLEEAKSIPFDSKTDLSALIKNIFCYGFSSKKVDAALEVCLKRCLYNGLKIDATTFEPASAREDYFKVCLEVVEDNISPFVKGLSAELSRLSAMIPNSQA